jgi:hypothetical protein
MNRRRLALLLAALAAPVRAADPPPPPKPAAPNAFVARFEQVRDRIDALFRRRGEAPPPSDPRFNPFRLPGAAETAAPAAGGPAPVAAGTPQTLLQQAAATLKVSGVFEISGKSHLVINGRPYRQGDVVQAQVQGETVYLRVKDIAKRSVTLALNDAELTLKF